MTDKTHRKILTRLKQEGPQTAAQLAEHFSMTSVGMRQHLDGMLSEELVSYEDVKGRVGRPRRFWSVSQKGQQTFPDTHDALALDVLTSVEALFGAEGVEAVINLREQKALAAYREQINPKNPLEERVRVLTDIRNRDGYMAEFQHREEGGFLIVENNCSICAAAQHHKGFCRSELKLFQKVLGEDCRVSRIDHIVCGDRRCSYVVEPV